MGSGASAEFAGVSESTFIFYNNFRLGEKLGSGGFSQVRLATDKVTRQKFAVKILDVTEPSPDYAADRKLNKHLDKRAKSEIAIWRHVCSSRHENVVQLSTVFAERGLYYLVAEKCKCTLTSMALDDLTEPNIVATLRQVFSAIEHIHLLGVMHRDIKPDNFLWGGSFNDRLKLCDFGLAVEIPFTGKKLNENCGTTSFKAPEMLQMKGYSESVDVWSAGVTAYLLTVGKLPYSGEGKVETEEMIKHGSCPVDFRGPFSWWRNSHAHLRIGSIVMEFIRRLLARDTTLRPTAKEVLKLPLFVDSLKPVWQSDVKEHETLANMQPVREEHRICRCNTSDLTQLPILSDTLSDFDH
mmetsp:Transcript_93734/g.166777  ORF Transcript_93734/g.166777 Transcript_93734/m.166777 type:complete len:354 (-) Transcript_93734:153-1214(-)|eukprot:CAMPEP_0197666058 /NCGR_PEP_ID=MMETSP1338-20131121/61416_1 /TAXON_ID=43686 ORGANISM="Pelagodinium beii, Strain RCC1491" /NCGR_SAMPLE_ID=MMETSP1338 /ASSEMBLY_ACC=CAM_ASM_000754 /LENGTH=353 /DNA_ID=CAMNT_0043245029 /DNA_START=51 /DNA_END=1112 /DNA_ORIENTATION=-